MMITDIIRKAETEHEVYFLLTAYLEAVRFGDQLGCLSEAMTQLPLAGIDDVRQRTAKLIGELDTASRRLDDKVCVVTKEALYVFSSGLERLRRLEMEDYRHAA